MSNVVINGREFFVSTLDIKCEKNKIKFGKSGDLEVTLPEDGCFHMVSDAEGVRIDFKE